jgi:rubredoxin
MCGSQRCYPEICNVLHPELEPPYTKLLKNKIINIEKIIFQQNIKCICGYEYEETYYEHDEDKHITKGDESFIYVNFNPTGMIIGGGMSYPDAYACPKCKTLKLR